eukprot:scaffold169144_cov41-Cyclotella_meneghiniana.AAC.3
MQSVRDTYDASFGAPPIELEHSSATKKTELLVNAKMELDEMEKVHRPDHGSFFTHVYKWEDLEKRYLEDH